MRAAIAQRHPEALRRSHRDIGPHRARLLEQAQRQQVGRDDGDAPDVMDPGDDVGEIGDMAVGARILEQRAEMAAGVHRLGIADLDRDAKGFGPGAHHRDGLGVAAPVHEESGRL